MTDSFEWQGKVGDTWASEWARTDRSFAELQSVLVDHIAAFAPDATRIVDIGCGAGTTTIALATRLPLARCLGIDLSPSLIAVAQGRSAAVPSTRFTVADVTLWDDPSFHPDLLVSRHGVMFFGDPIAAFAHLRSVAAPGATLVFSCFRSPTENPWTREIGALLPALPPTDPHAAGPFAFADAERVGAILTQAGWRNARAEPVNYAYIAGAGSDPVGDALAFFGQIGPAARAVHDLRGEALADFLGRLHGSCATIWRAARCHSTRRPGYGRRNDNSKEA